MWTRILIALTCVWLLLGGHRVGAREEPAPSRYFITLPGPALGKASPAFLGLGPTDLVAGAWLIPGGGPTRAFLWDDGDFIALPSFEPGGDCQARAVNAKGQVVGTAHRTFGGFSFSEACLWEGERLIDLGPFDGAGSSAAAINDAGQVVGFFWLRSEMASLREGALGRAMLGFRWEKGHRTRLQPLAGGHGSAANGINSRGETVGWSGTADGGTHAVRWVGDDAQDLGSLPDQANSQAMAINDRGQVVGTAVGAGEVRREETVLPNGGKQVRISPVPGKAAHAVLWENGKITDLGCLDGHGTTPHAINTKGQVVGEAGILEGKPRAFLWENGKLVDLNTLIPAESGWTVYSAHGINDSGQIIVDGIKGGTGHGLLLTPRG